jgi:AcrR family transcriptional regulator
MPRLELGDIRREQICRSAAAVIAERGFPGSTMRLVAEHAEVSTGMLNHYFSNRAEMLLETLVFVSKGMSGRCAAAIEGVPAGEQRIRALLNAALPNDNQSIVCWRVWIAAYGEAVRSDQLRTTIESRLEPWYEIVDYALDGADGAAAGQDVPLSWQFDALLNGLAIQWLTAKTDLELEQIEETIVAFVMNGDTD